MPRPDFVVWPESSSVRDPFEDPTIYDGIDRAAAAIGVPLLVGAIVDAGGDNVLSQGIVWDPLTGAGERYKKRHPVAFGEYIPLRGLLPQGLVETASCLASPATCSAAAVRLR